MYFTRITYAFFSFFQPTKNLAFFVPITWHPFPLNDVSFIYLFFAHVINKWFFFKKKKIFIQKTFASPSLFLVLFGGPGQRKPICRRYAAAVYFGFWLDMLFVHLKLLSFFGGLGTMESHNDWKLRWIEEFTGRIAALWAYACPVMRNSRTHFCFINILWDY